jgi:aminoglycoside phosphotransferase (APT) family kinase protein
MQNAQDKLAQDLANGALREYLRAQGLVGNAPLQVRVLDWELSTLGHPLADLAYQCMGWRIPHDLWRGIGGFDLQALGIPSEGEYVGWYEQATGRTALHGTLNAGALHGVQGPGSDMFSEWL